MLSNTSLVGGDDPPADWLCGVAPAALLDGDARWVLRCPVSRLGDATTGCGGDTEDAFTGEHERCIREAQRWAIHGGTLHGEARGAMKNQRREPGEDKSGRTVPREP